MAELGGTVFAQSGYYVWDMDREPVIAQLGMDRPELPGVDMGKYQTAAQQSSSYHKRRLAEPQTKQEKEQKAQGAKS